MSSGRRACAASRRARRRRRAGRQAGAEQAGDRAVGVVEALGVVDQQHDRAALRRAAGRAARSRRRPGWPQRSSAGHSCRGERRPPIAAMCTFLARQCRGDRPQGLALAAARRAGDDGVLALVEHELGDGEVGLAHRRCGIRHGSAPRCAVAASEASGTSVGRTPIGFAAGVAPGVAAGDRGGGSSTDGRGWPSWMCSALCGHHRAARRRLRHVLDGQSERDVVVGVGEPEEPLLGRDRHPRRRDRVRAVGADREVDAGLRAVGVDARELVHQLQSGGVVELRAQRGEVVDQHDGRAARRPAGGAGRARRAAGGSAASGARGRPRGSPSRCAAAPRARAGRRRRSRARRPRAAPAGSVPERLRRGSASAVVVPLPGMPKSSRLPSSRSQPTGYWRLAARLVGERDERADAVLRASGQLGEVEVRGQRLRPRPARGGMPSAALASRIASTSRSRSDGCSPTRLGLRWRARAPAPRAEDERGDVDRGVALGVGHAGDQGALDRARPRRGRAGRRRGPAGGG